MALDRAIGSIGIESNDVIGYLDHLKGSLS
jgi:hypothetical protein